MSLLLEISGGNFLGRPYRTDHLLAGAIGSMITPGAPWFQFVTIEGEPCSKSPRGSADHAAQVRERLGLSFEERAVGNVAVGCLFFRSNRQRIDADNLLKFILDAGTGVCWNDDSQVTAIAGFIEHEPQRPRTLLVVGPHQSSMGRTGIGSTQRECRSCRARFWTWNKAAKFCSRSCMARANERLAGEIACAWCQKPFRRRTTKQIFCGDPCRMQRLIAGRRAHAVVKPDCRSCGKPLSRHGYALCRACWRSAR